MLIQGLGGVSRRLADGGASYAHAQEFLHWNVVMSYSAWLLAVAQIPFIYNLINNGGFARYNQQTSRPELGAKVSLLHTH